MGPGGFRLCELSQGESELEFCRDPVTSDLTRLLTEGNGPLEDHRADRRTGRCDPCRPDVRPGTSECAGVGHLKGVVEVLTPFPGTPGLVLPWTTGPGPVCVGRAGGCCDGTFDRRLSLGW